MLKICNNFLLLKGRQMVGTVRIFYIPFFSRMKRFWPGIFSKKKRNQQNFTFPQMWKFFWPLAQKLSLSSGKEMAAVGWSEKIRDKRSSVTDGVAHPTKSGQTWSSRVSRNTHCGLVSVLLTSNGAKPAGEPADPPGLSCRPLLTVIDGAAVAAEVGFHQRSLFLALFGSPSARPPVHVGLDHQGLLPLFLLLLLEEHPLAWRWARKRDRTREGRGCTDGDVRVAIGRSSHFSNKWRPDADLNSERKVRPVCVGVNLCRYIFPHNVCLCIFQVLLCCFF